jgi:hypothetical protein
MAGHDVYYKKTKREQTIRRRQSRTTAILFSFPFVGVVQPTGWQGTTSTTKERKENDQAATIDDNSDPVLSSFRRRRSTHWMAGHDVYYKRTTDNDQAATINDNSDPVLSSFRRRRSTHWMAGHNVYYKKTTENDQAATIDNNSNTRATINNNHSPLPRKSNNKLCVVAVELESNWSECTLRTNGVENIPPRIILGLECRND